MDHRIQTELHINFIAEYLGGLLKLPTVCLLFSLFACSRNPLNTEPLGELIVTTN